MNNSLNCSYQVGFENRGSTVIKFTPCNDDFKLKISNFDQFCKPLNVENDTNVYGFSIFLNTL